MTTPPEQKRSLAVDLYAVVLAMHRGATEQLVHAISDEGYSLSELKLLHVLARPHRRPPRIASVARLLGLTSPAATRLVQHLERERDVDCIADEDDGRAKRVVLTPAGRALVERLDRARIGDLQRFVDALDGDERRVLKVAVDELVKRPEIAALRPAE